VHSGYQRTLADLSIGGGPVEIRLHVRRFFCDGSPCPAKTFAEQIPGLTMRRVRRTLPLRESLTHVALALAGRAGTRLAALLGIPASRNTLLRLVNAVPDPEVGTITTLGVDDFAFRKGHTYGTVLIDMDTHRPVDLLDNREAATLAAWLTDHPGVEVVCRDRAGAYAEGATTGAPEAVQVADRWHLWHNLATYVEKAVARHRSCLKEPDAPASEPTPDAVAPGQQKTETVETALFEQRAFVQRARQRYAEVQELKAQGLGIKTIKRQLGLAKETVRKYYRAASVEEILAKARDGRPSKLDAFKPYLHQRFNDGHTNASRLFEEIHQQGYRGSRGTVISYLQPFRVTGTAPAAAPAPPKIRDATRWILTHPDHLDEDDTLALKNLLARCPTLQDTARHVASFAEMLTGQHGERLDAWMAEVEAAKDLPELHSFVRGLKKDYAAVLNGLTRPESSGAVEGNVNRIKMFKRQMYGRAGFALLRKRVLLAS
jgi:transposase